MASRSDDPVGGRRGGDDSHQRSNIEFSVGKRQILLPETF